MATRYRPSRSIERMQRTQLDGAEILVVAIDEAKIRMAAGFGREMARDDGAPGTTSAALGRMVESARPRAIIEPDRSNCMPLLEQMMVFDMLSTRPTYCQLCHHAMTSLSALGLALSGCAGESDGAATDASPGLEMPAAAAAPMWTTPTEPCDPLAPHELPIQLGTVIAAGEDGRGTLYVADETASGSGERVFVSRGDTLYRKCMSGGGAKGGTDFTWSFDDDGTPERLVAHREGDVVTGIALAPADERTFFDQLDDRAERLTPVDASTLVGFHVRNQLCEPR